MITPTPRSEAADAAITRLLWREQVRALPRSLWAAVRRLLRLEPRWYYVIDGRVAARLVSAEDRDDLLRWIARVHAETFHYGVGFGQGVAGAVDSGQSPDSGDAGTA